MTELDSLSKISIIKDTTVWPGFNLINRQGSRVGVWKETDNSTYTELEYFKGGKETIQKIYSRKTGSLEIFVHDIEDNFGDIYYSFDFKSIVVQCSNFRLNNREFIGRMPNRNRYKYRCIIIGFFSNGAVSSIGDMEYYESPMCDGEDLWMRYFKEDGTESDVDLYDYKKRRGRDLNNLDSCGRRQGLWLEDDGYREVYYKDGVVDGIFRSYSRKTGTLLSIGWYCKGMLSGRWFYFDEQGKLLRIDDHPDLEGSPVWLANSYLSK